MRHDSGLQGMVGAGKEIQALGRKFWRYDLRVDEGAVYEVDGGLPPQRLALEAAIQWQ